MLHRTPIVLVDDGVGRFGPVGALRAAFELRTGRDTVLERHRRHWGDRLVAVWVPAAVAPLVAERVDVPVNILPDAPRVTLISGRWAIPDAALRTIPDEVIVTDASEGEMPGVVAADLDSAAAAALLRGDGPPAKATIRRVDPTTLLSRPWHLLEAIEASIRHDLLASRDQATVEPADSVIVLRGQPIVVAATARICPGAVIDSEHGPVIVLDHALVRPRAVLCGPCVVGAGAVVAENAIVRGRTVIGPRCKIGGEVSGCIFQGNSNKVHDGFLGDSVVGEWVNLGAGTIGSNLLNTYGETTMRLDPDRPREHTGRQFMGAVIGDHVKTAIGTRIMTATSLGFGAMIAASTPPPTTVPPFAWVTDEGTRTYRLEKFVETMTRVMARRGVVPTEATIDAVRTMHARAAP